MTDCVINGQDYAPTPAKDKDLRIGMRIPKHFKCTENQLIVEPDDKGNVPWEDAELMGKQLFRIAELHENTLPWLIGDYILYCEDMYGERFAQVVDGGLYSQKTITNYVYMCRNVPPENRWPPRELSPSHHMCIAGLEHDSQKIALQKAYDESWSVSEFRLWLAGSSQPEKDAQAYSARFRASYIKRGVLPEGIAEKPWVEEHRKRILREADLLDSPAKKAPALDEVLRKATGSGELDSHAMFGVWWKQNETVIDGIEDTKEACKYVWDSVIAIARRAWE